MRTIIVTGASDGIGRSIAVRLSQAQNNLILFGRDLEKLKAVKAQCEAFGSAVDVYAFDLTDNDRRRSTIDEILAHRTVDVLINNAGIWHKVGDVTSLSESTISDVIETNLTSHILLTRQLLNQMRNRENTAIVNVVSKSGIVAQSGQTVYTASKYGMKGFTDVLRQDTASEPIRIAALYQEGTNTGMFAKAGDDFPIDSFTNPDDLAEVIAFILTRPEKIWLNEIHVTF